MRLASRLFPSYADLDGSGLLKASDELESALTDLRVPRHSDPVDCLIWQACKDIDAGQCMDFEAFFALAAGALMTQQPNEGTDSTNQSVRNPCKPIATAVLNLCHPFYTLPIQFLTRPEQATES